MLITNDNENLPKHISIEELYRMLNTFKSKEYETQQTLLLNWLPNIWEIDFINDGDNSKTDVYFLETISDSNSLSKIELGRTGLEYQFELYYNQADYIKKKR